MKDPCHLLLFLIFPLSIAFSYPLYIPSVILPLLFFPHLFPSLLVSFQILKMSLVGAIFIYGGIANGLKRVLCHMGG